MSTSLQHYLLSCKPLSLGLELMHLIGDGIDVPTDLAALPLAKEHHHCVECDHTIEVVDVEIGLYCKFVHRNDARIDRSGSDDFTPEVKGLATHYYDTTCSSCKQALEDEDYKPFGFGWK